MESAGIFFPKVSFRLYSLFSSKVELQVPGSFCSAVTCSYVDSYVLAACKQDSTNNEKLTQTAE